MTYDRVPHILVVDDNSDIRELVTIWLKKEIACDLTTAANGYEASQLFNSQRFDLIISDVSMPNGTGEELLDYARSVGVSAPFVFFTASDFGPRARFVFDSRSVLVGKMDLKHLVKIVCDRLTEQGFHLTKSGDRS